MKRWIQVMDAQRWFQNPQVFSQGHLHWNLSRCTWHLTSQKSKRWCFKAELERTCHSLADCVQVLQISTWIWLASWPISSHVTLLISLVPRPCMIINHVHYLYIMLIIYISCSLFINHAHYLYILYISCSLFINHEHYS